ncbi:MAG TPA: PTS system mannose/fructose/sorbose family transporter subunit IID [Anaeromyxobacteraceae bacterium]|nr:PTS system mannose/fructose/sorbose family transporter subunit IID [Anaeromyxobacteraceae bacterium]
MSVPPVTLRRVFWRCLFLQAAWNRRGMQNLGFAYAIDPALRRIYPDPARRAEALRRHLATFNCHPYTAAAIVGGAIHHEERVAAGAEPVGAPLEYKQVLQGPLAAVGDGFFWAGLRPFFGALAAAGTVALGWPALVACVLLYNAVHLWLRWTLFRAGYRSGDEVVTLLAGLALPAWAARLRDGGAIVAGVGAGLLALSAAGLVAPAAALAVLAAAAAGTVALALRARLLPTAYAALALGAALGAATRLFPGGR